MAKKTTRRTGGDNTLNITSMMDMMTIILVFLLMNFSAEDISVVPSDDLQIPLSSAQAVPKLAVNVIVSRKDIVVDGQKVLDLERGVDSQGQETLSVPEDEKRGQLINKLHDVLSEKADHAKAIGSRTGVDEFDFQGEILLQCDKRLPFSLVREVMFTAGQAQFGNFRFVVVKSGG